MKAFSLISLNLYYERSIEIPKGRGKMMQKAHRGK